jgi:hypothetical protein
MKLIELMEATVKFKYPRTPHLPWSEGATSDDKILKSVDHFENEDVVVTEKMDGENTTLYKDASHARSLDSKNHPSRNWVKQMHASIANDIPDGWRICGENVYAQHSISYKNLKSYFYVFSIWNENNECLSWDETEEWCKLLGLVHVPVLYRGKWDGKLFSSKNPFKFDHDAEGYVIRKSGKFSFSEFSKSIAKFVRKNHVQTDTHWMELEVVPNKLEK